MGSQSQTIPSTPSDPPTSAVPQLAMTMQATGGKKMTMHHIGYYLTREQNITFLDRKCNVFWAISSFGNNCNVLVIKHHNIIIVLSIFCSV